MKNVRDPMPKYIRVIEKLGACDTAMCWLKRRRFRTLSQGVAGLVKRKTLQRTPSVQGQLRAQLSGVLQTSVAKHRHRSPETKLQPLQSFRGQF